MRAGPLRHRVTIERPVEARTGSGAVRADYQPWLERIAASVEDVRGDERWLANQIVAEVSTRIRIRYREGITAKMRVLHRRAAGSPTLEDVYEINAVVRADGRKDELWLFCTRRDGEGFRAGAR